MHANESICRSHQTQLAAVGGLNPNCSPTVAVCLFTQTCPCVRRMLDEGSGDFMTFLKPHVVKFRDFAASGQIRHQQSSAKQEKCEAESKAQQVGRTGKVVFSVAALMSSKSHLKGPVWLDSCKSVQLLHFKMEKNYHQYLYGRLDWCRAMFLQQCCV